MHVNKLRFAFLVVALQLLSTFTSAQTTTDAPLPRPGKPIERELRGGDVHTYAVQLTAGQFLAVIVDQRGIDVVVSLLGPDGQKLEEIDSPTGVEGPEAVSAVVQSTGQHKVEVRALEKGAGPGRYEIKTEALREATAEDKKLDRIKALAARLRTVKSEEEGLRLLENQNELITPALWKWVTAINRTERPQQVLIAHRLALHVAERADYRQGIAESHLNIGLAYQRHGNTKLGLEHLLTSLRLSDHFGDKNRLTSSLLRSIGEFYRQQGDYVKAIEFNQRNLKLNEELGLKPGIAQALNNLGIAHRLAGNLSLASAALHRSLKLFEELQLKTGMAYALANLADVFLPEGDHERALEYAQRSRSLFEEIKNPAGLGRALAALGVIHRARGEYDKALEYFKQSLQLLEEVGDWFGVSLRLINISEIYRIQGKYSLALEHAQRNLELNERQGNKNQILRASDTVGETHRIRGDYAIALTYFQRNLALSQELQIQPALAEALNKIGLVHYWQGNYAHALTYFQKALATYQQTGSKRWMGRALSHLSQTYGKLRDYPRAMEYGLKALTIREELGDKWGIADTTGTLGDVLRQSGDSAQALIYLQRSLKASEEIDSKRDAAFALKSMAIIYNTQSKYAQALETGSRAVSIAREIGSREYLWEGLTAVGQASEALGRTRDARQAFEEAIAVVERLRANVAGQESRAVYFANVQKPYEGYIDLLMKLHWQSPSEGYDTLALQTSERARARSLLEALSEANADIRQGVDPALLQREQELRQQLSATGERQTRLLTEKHTDLQVANVKRDIERLTVEFQDVQVQIRQRSPQYAALTQPAPLDLKEIQALLDADTLLLEYALGEERSYLWAITPTSISSFELPKRSEIESGVRRAVSLLSDGKQWTTSDKVEVEYAAVTAGLSRMLLAPVAEQLKRKRLVIVADGALQYLPFSALPSPKSGTSKTAPTQSPPLIADFEIVNLPSASTLAILRRETANRASATGSVAVLADPVFEETDQRVQVAISQNKSGATTSVSKVRNAALPETRDSRAILERAFRVESTTNGDGAKSEVLRISRLPFTRFEAEGILASVPRTQSFKATDFRASRETATSADLSKYRFIHFATHGILNTEHPELSGVVLSLVDEHGKPVDGFLRLHDIYNLNLPADLVVLSACQTGLGKEIRGEGLVGLTRGFMYAGSPRVVASLWKVDDAATAELMKRFYRGMLKDNLRPAAALRLAKIEMWKQKRWNAPFYWAAFELQGEWK